MQILGVGAGADEDGTIFDPGEASSYTLFDLCFVVKGRQDVHVDGLDVMALQVRGWQQSYSKVPKLFVSLGFGVEEPFFVYFVTVIGFQLLQSNHASVLSASLTNSAGATGSQAIFGEGGRNMLVLAMYFAATEKIGQIGLWVAHGVCFRY